MSEGPHAGESDQTEIQKGLQEGSPVAEAKVRSGQFTDSELGLGPDTMDQEATVEAQRDELERDELEGDDRPA